MTRALVTGGAGFIGANVVRRLVIAGHDVHVLIRPGSRRWRLEEFSADVTLYEVNLEDADAVARAVRIARPEWIFHLAARGAYSWQRDVQEILRVNVLGTANLLQAAVSCGIETFVYAGTSSEYGFKDHAPTEDETVEPTSPYAASKVSATTLCQVFAHTTGIRTVTLRLYSAFGAWEEPGRLLPNVILCGLRRELPPLVSPDAAHDFVYVDDVVDACLLAAADETVEPGAIFNVGTGVQTTLAEVVSLARRVLNIDAAPQWDTMNAKPWDTGVWVADSSRITRALGWTPRHTFEEGFRKQIAWFNDDPHIIALYEELIAQRAARSQAEPVL